MGIARMSESKKIHPEELRKLLLKCSADRYRSTKPEHQIKQDHPHKWREIKQEDEEEEEEKLVCVTSGLSFLGLDIVNRLLSRGYSVRIAVDNEEDMEKLRDVDMLGVRRKNNGEGVSAVMAKVTDMKSLHEAFQGCCGVFHTSAFIDPSGVSGYTKYMAELEVKGNENVMEACARTDSVRKCVITSSLLACVWRDNAVLDFPRVVDHNCWSDESICRDKKLWFALGKTMAERAAWRMAEESQVKLATICPGLITGPNSTSSIAYLKGAQEMYGEGLLATTDVSRVAEAHVCVFEALKDGAFGRYICFDRVIQTEEEADELARQMGMAPQTISGNTPTDSPIQFKLCNTKLSRLMSTRSRCS